MTQGSSSPIRVAVTGAAGQIAYSLLFNLASGGVFGPQQPIVLQLLDIAPAMEALKGVVMELQDCALPLLTDAIATDNPKVAFKDADYAILVGAMPRKEGMVRKDLLKANVGIFKVQGEAIDEVAKKTCKILVVGNPANTNALICKHYAPSIPAENFTALTRLDENRARSQIAMRLKVPVENVKNVCIWGNHSNTQFPDVAHGYVLKNGHKSSVYEAINDENYLHGEYIKTVSLRGAAIINARKLSSAMSAAKAICDHIRDWHYGIPEGEYVSMGVVSDGSYGMPKGLIFSYPVQINKSGKYTIVGGLSISDFAKVKLDATAQELSEEREEALSHLSAKV